MPINKTKIFTMKNLLSFLLILPLFISCGGDDSSNHAKSEIVVSPELFLYEGAFFNAPKCEDVEGIEMNWLNPGKFPEDTVCVVKECYPNGQLKSKARLSNKSFDGEHYIYTDTGTLQTIILYDEGKQVNTKYFREDKTMFSQEENKNGVIDLTRMTYGLKGELRKTEIIVNRSVVSCEGPDCP